MSVALLDCAQLIVLMRKEMQNDSLYDGYGLELILERHRTSVGALSDADMLHVTQCLKNNGFPEWVDKFCKARLSSPKN